MSDVSDWTQSVDVSAGSLSIASGTVDINNVVGTVTTVPAARLVTSGVLNGATNVNVALNPTDRSIILMVSGGNAGNIMGAVGQTTGFDYLGILNQTGAVPVSIFSGIMYIPVFGVLDSVVQLQLGGGSVGAHYRVMATPDQFLDGNQATPLSVRLQTSNAGGLGETKVLGQIGLTAAPQLLVGGSTAGLLRHVTTIMYFGVTAGDLIEFGMNSAAANSGFNAPAQQAPIFTGDWIINPNGPGLWVLNNSGNRGNMYAIGYEA